MNEPTGYALTFSSDRYQMIFNHEVVEFGTFDKLPELDNIVNEWVEEPWHAIREPKNSGNYYNIIKGELDEDK